MYLYEAPRAKGMTRNDAAWWLAEQTGITPAEARERILAELVPAEDGWYDDEALADLAILITEDSF